MSRCHDPQHIRSSKPTWFIVESLLCHWLANTSVPYNPENLEWEQIQHLPQDPMNKSTWLSQNPFTELHANPKSFTPQ